MENLNEILQSHILKEKKSAEDLYDQTTKKHELEMNNLKKNNEKIVNEYENRISTLVEQTRLLMKEKEDRDQEIILLRKENKILREHPPDSKSDSFLQNTTDKYDLHEEIKNDQEINKIYNEKIKSKNNSNSFLFHSMNRNKPKNSVLDENHCDNMTRESIIESEENEIYSEIRVEKVKGKGKSQNDYERDTEINERGNNCNVCNIM